MTPTDLKVTLIQSKLAWEQKQANLDMFTDKIRGIAEDTDLIVLPEMFTTGFTMNASAMAEDMQGPTILWMKSVAAEKSCVITGSFIAVENGRYYNRLIWMPPDGNYLQYDKRHLFRMAEEDNYFAPGMHNITVELKGWKIRPLICYDLRFPVWSRNLYSGEKKAPIAEYDLLIYIANWPEARATAWDTLLRARAVENQVYCLGVNRTGMDGKQIPYNGHSAVIDPKGEYMQHPIEKEERILSQLLDYNELANFRAKFPVGMDADSFDLKI